MLTKTLRVGVKSAASFSQLHQQTDQGGSFMKFRTRPFYCYLLIGFLNLALSLPLHAGFDEGKAAYMHGDYAAALKEWRPLAKRGDATAQFALGVMYHKGQGVPQDYKEAVSLFRKAAEQGLADAQYNLGQMHRTGQGVPEDYKEAAKWFRKAAEQGLAVAQNNLGLMYDNGQGVPQDYKEAVTWYREAAEQELAAAQYNLGAMYATGRGVPQDKVLAYALCNLSAANDPSAENNAPRNRNALAQELSPRQLDEGQVLTRQLMQPGNFTKTLDARFSKTTR